MFGKHKLSRDGAQAQALVIEKKIYATEVESGTTSACRYKLRVRFEDGSTIEVSRRAFGHAVASAAVGDVIPVRYDPADRSNIQLDSDALVEREKARTRDIDDRAIARGEQALGLPPRAPLSLPSADPRQPDTDDLRIGDADRELIAGVLSRHMTDGRLTIDELDDRLGALYKSRSRDEARSALAGLPPLVPSAGPQREAAPPSRTGRTLRSGLWPHERRRKCRPGDRAAVPWAPCRRMASCVRRTDGGKRKPRR